MAACSDAASSSVKRPITHPAGRITSSRNNREHIDCGPYARESERATTETGNDTRYSAINRYEEAADTIQERKPALIHY